MSKQFTNDDILKKHQTNIKSATSGFVLVGILGIIYIVRFLFSGNFNFYFSLAFSELVLRLGDGGKIPEALGFVLTAVYVICFICIALLINKKTDNLKFALLFYAFDSICFVPLAFVLADSFAPDFFIDVIVHLFVILFIIVGIKSVNSLKKTKA